MSIMNAKRDQPEPVVADAKEPEIERFIPQGLKTTVDVAGFAPIVGNFASIGSATMSGAELAYQYAKGNKAGMKAAALDLAADATSILATRVAGAATKSATKLAAKGLASEGKIAAVLAKAGAHGDKLVKVGEKVAKVGITISTIGGVLGKLKKT